MGTLNKTARKNVKNTMKQYLPVIQANWSWKAVFAMLNLTCCLYSPAAHAAFDTSKDNWALLGGYGQSVPDWGQTTQRVETLDIIPRYNHIIFDNIGSGWYRGFHSILLELPVSVVVSPDTSAMVGMNFLATYTFTANTVWKPYLFGGGGPVYNFADIPGMGADLNGNYQFGAGLKYHSISEHDLLFEVRYHHISNGGSEEPNDPLNSWKVLFGVSF
ncbi:acyloxyacyl hydrolase [Desulfogranum japonicum]|uniref:acyloxyacyl hydrolase n=1 Tax=Desulfogranum japonicum TaxID=231447 RepID=UPI0004017C16|nr:acyloxyacyl hydrolase [Desulfogranum japonicum]